MNIVELIASNHLREYLHLAPKSVRPLLTLSRVALKKFDFDGSPYLPVAFGSRDSAGKPNGLLVAEIRLDSNQIVSFPLAKSVDVRSLYVDKFSRNQGIAKSLIDALCCECSQWPGTSINIVYPKDQVSSPFLEKLTDQSKGWKSNKSIYYVTIDDCQPLYDFVRRCDNVGKRQAKKFNFVVEPLSDYALDEIQLTAEKSMLETWTLPSNLDDFILPSYSRTLRIGGDLIGWFLCTEQPPNCLFYRAGWVFPDWQNKGGLLALIASICDQAHFKDFDEAEEVNSMNPYSSACFEFDSVNLPMVKFSENQLIPRASSVICTIDKELTLL